MSAVDVLANLTHEEIAVLIDVQDGADVWGYPEAKLLRSIQQKAPDLINIGKALESVPGHMRQPYFGCIATSKARRALARVQGGES